MRAIELAVQGRDNPRLLIATKRRPTNLARIARLLAGLANAAAGRTAVLLVGIRGRSVVGLDEVPDAEWWDQLKRMFPGAAPELVSTVVDIDDARVLAISPEPAGELVTATENGRVVVPLFEAGSLRACPSPGPTWSEADTARLTRVVDGWVERVATPDGAVVIHRGQLEVVIDAETGFIADEACKARLLLPGDGPAVELDAQIHPMTDDVAVLRGRRGVEVLASFRAHLFLAGAARSRDSTGPEPGPVQLVVTVPAPGGHETEPWSKLLEPDPTASGSRWVVEAP